MTNTLILRAFVAVAVFVSVSFSLGPAVMAEPPGSAEDVRIVVYLIEASDGIPGVDDPIRSIVKQLHGTFRYSTYKLVSRIPKRIRIGSHEKIALPEARELHLYARGHKDGRIKLKVKIVEKPTGGRQHDALSTEFRIVKGGTIIIGGYDYHDGKLIVAISADM